MPTYKLAQEGSIIIASDPEEPGLIVKRITKMGGDEVFWRRIMNSIKIPEDHIWVEGDNPHASGNFTQYNLYYINIIPLFYYFSGF